VEWVQGDGRRLGLGTAAVCDTHGTGWFWGGWNDQDLGGGNRDVFVEHSIRLLYSVKCGLNAVGPVGGERGLSWRVIDVSLAADAFFLVFGVWPRRRWRSNPTPSFRGVAER
jgi:hypothetical protein